MQKNIDKKVFCNIQRVCRKDVRDLLYNCCYNLGICQQQAYALKEVFRITVAVSASEGNEVK